MTTTLVDPAWRQQERTDGDERDELPFTIPTLGDIRSWLGTLPPDEIAGTCASPWACLVARATEHLNPDMAFEVIWADGGGEITGFHNDDYGQMIARLALPDDINHLAERFDALGPLYCERCDLLTETTCDMTAREVLFAWPRLVARR